MTYPHFKGSYAEAGDPVGEYVMDALPLPTEMCGGADWSVHRVWLLGDATVGGYAGRIYMVLDNYGGGKADVGFGLTFRPEVDDDGEEPQDAWDQLDWCEGTPQGAEAWHHILHDTDHGLAWAESAMNAGHHPGYGEQP